MKDFLKVLMGVLIGLMISYGLCVNCMMPIDCCSTETVDDSPNPDGGDSVDYQNVSTYCTNFKTQFLKPEQSQVLGCEGGKISIVSLAKVIASASRTDEYIYFRIGYEPNSPTPLDGKVFTMFSAGSMLSATSNYPVYRNSGQSFCPTSCD